MNAQKRREIFERFARANPHPTTELQHQSPFELLVAVVLSAQATDKGVNIATHELFKRVKTPQQMLELGESGLIEYIKSVGLYRSKAKNLIAACRQIVDEHGGRVPDTREALEKLPGVGRKTASVILNTAFDQPTIAVDTHIFRVANRTGIARGRNVSIVERGLTRLVPREFHKNAHHWLILHGRYICKARKPLCPECLIFDLCEFKYKEPKPETSGLKS
jgi:endonuclease III